MLTLGIRPGDYVVIGDSIVIQVVEVDNQFRVAIDAPKDVPIQRAEVFEQHSPPPPCIARARKKNGRAKTQVSTARA